jgi:hypothetical protein
MTIDDLVTGAWNKARDLGGRVKGCFGKTLRPEKVEVSRAGNGGNGGYSGAQKFLLYLMAVAATCTLAERISRAATYNRDSKPIVPTTQGVGYNEAKTSDKTPLEDSVNMVAKPIGYPYQDSRELKTVYVNFGATVNIDPTQTTTDLEWDLNNNTDANDTIIFTPAGTHNVPYGDSLTLPPNRWYTTDGNEVVISGSGTEHVSTCEIINGGNINFYGNFIFKNTKDAFYVGETVYHDIFITDVNLAGISRFGVWMDNVPHASPLTEESVTVRGCYIKDADKLIKYYAGILPMNEYSPYPGAYDNFVKNLGVWMMDAPKGDITGGSIHILSENSMAGNVVVDCKAISDPCEYYLFQECPEEFVYLNILRGYYGDPNNNNVDANDSDFMPDRETSRRDSDIMNKGFGKYRGPIEPYHEVEGNINWDGNSQEIVDFRDWAVGADRYSLTGDMNDVLPVINDWLVIEPNDPNGNPKP